MLDHTSLIDPLCCPLALWDSGAQLCSTAAGLEFQTQTKKHRALCFMHVITAAEPFLFSIFFFHFIYGIMFIMHSNMLLFNSHQAGAHLPQMEVLCRDAACINKTVVQHTPPSHCPFHVHRYQIHYWDITSCTPTHPSPVPVDIISVLQGRFNQGQWAFSANVSMINRRLRRSEFRGKSIERWRRNA